MSLSIIFNLKLCFDTTLYMFIIQSKHNSNRVNQILKFVWHVLYYLSRNKCLQMSDMVSLRLRQTFHQQLGNLCLSVKLYLTENEEKYYCKLEIATLTLISTHFLLVPELVWGQLHLSENKVTSKFGCDIFDLTGCWSSILRAFLTLFLHASKSSLLFSRI